MQDSAIHSDWLLTGAARSTASPPVSSVWRRRWRQLRIDRVQVGIVLGAVLASVAVASLLHRGVALAQQEVQTHVRRQDEALVRAFRQHVTQAFERVDDLLKDTRRQWQQNRRLREQWQLARDLPGSRPLVFQVAVIDAQGRLAASSIDPGREAGPLRLDDRPHFRVHVGSRADRLYVGQPVVGRVSSRPSIQLSRPIFTPAGEFDGVIVASVDPGLVQDFFADRPGETQPGYGLLGDDGLARAWVGAGGASLEMFRASPQLQRLSNGRVRGALQTPATAQQPPLSWYLEPLEAFPLNVVVATDRAALMARLDALAAMAWALAAVLSACLGVGAFHLVRSRRRSHAMLRQMRALQFRLKAASELKSRFLGGVSHELRTPIHAILGFSELVAMGNDPAQSASLGALIHQHADRLHALVNTLLDLAQIDTGGMTVSRLEWPLHDLCEVAIGLHRPEAQKKGLALELVVAPGLPATLRTDRIKLTQVLDKVLGNAIRATRQGRVTLYVERQGGQWLFRVEDTSPGLTLEQLESLFERIDDPPWSHESLALEQRMALELILCRELVVLLGGHVGVHSLHGQGTSIEIWLPA